MKGLANYVAVNRRRAARPQDDAEDPQDGRLDRVARAADVERALPRVTAERCDDDVHHQLPLARRKRLDDPEQVGVAVAAQLVRRRRALRRHNLIGQDQPVWRDGADKLDSVCVQLECAAVQAQRRPRGVANHRRVGGVARTNLLANLVLQNQRKLARLVCRTVESAEVLAELSAEGSRHRVGFDFDLKRPPPSGFASKR